ncbi:fatty acid synthase alpha subunit Lsd1, partial [Dipsacomyces acuminosporus]
YTALTTGSASHGLLNLVHQTHHIEYTDGAQPLRVGDVIDYKAQVTEISNTDIGKSIKVSVFVYSGGIQVAQINDEVVYRNVFIDPELSFKHVAEPVSLVTLHKQEDVAVLETREWFVYCDGMEGSLRPGSKLEFHLTSDYRYKSRTIYSSTSIAGQALLHTSTSELVHVANVHFESGVSAGNPVTEYLSQHGELPGSPAMIENGGYRLVPNTRDKHMSLVARSSNWEYAHISGDYNPIHTNRYIADLVHLPGTITHGLWTSAATRCFIERHAAGDQPERVRSYKAEFLGMVLPNDQLETKLFHVGMKEGRMLVKGQTFNAGGRKVLECMAEIDQQPTAYSFTGQGSQAVGMGMDVYEASPSAQ